MATKELGGLSGGHQKSFKTPEIEIKIQNCKIEILTQFLFIGYINHLSISNRTRHMARNTPGVLHAGVSACGRNCIGPKARVSCMVIVCNVTIDGYPAHNRGDTYLPRDRKLPPSWFQHNSAKLGLAILQLTCKIGTYIWDLVLFLHYNEALHNINYRKTNSWLCLSDTNDLSRKIISLEWNASEKVSHFCMLCLFCTFCNHDVFPVLLCELL